MRVSRANKVFARCLPNELHFYINECEYDYAANKLIIYLSAWGNRESSTFVVVILGKSPLCTNAYMHVLNNGIRQKRTSAADNYI